MNDKYEIYIVAFSSMNYCGAENHCSVWASSDEEAVEKATDWAEEYMYEQDTEQLEEDGYDEGPYAAMGEAVPLIGSEFEKYYSDHVQRDNFYPQVGEGWPEV